MFEMIWRKTKKITISAQDKAILTEMVESHRLEILKEWEQKVNPL